MTESPEAAAGEQAEATGPETQATQQLRAEKIEAQRRAQFESNDRVRQWKAIQQGKQAKEIPVVGEFAEETAKKVYKRGWQIAQEVVEDMALSLSDFFLFTGPAVVGLYLIRWIGGNMMGGLFVKEVTLPALLGQGQGEQKFYVQLIPGYSIDDPIDYVRHIKFLVVAAITGIIYGIIFLILYLALNPTEAAKLGLKALTAGLSAVNPIVNLFLSK